MFNTKFIQTLIIASLFLVILPLGGCIGDDDPPPIVAPVHTPVQAETTDALMAHFETSYTQMLLIDFEEFLHDDFKLILLTSTIDGWGLAPGTILDRDQMLFIHENMFAGMAGSDPVGNTINPLDYIEILTLNRVTAWDETLPDDPHFPGSQYARYDARMRFHDNTGTHAFAVDNQMIFYADQVGDFWYLSGIRPLASYKASEQSSYDSVLYLFN